MQNTKLADVVGKLNFSGAIKLNRLMHREKFGMPQFEYVEYDFDQIAIRDDAGRFITLVRCFD